MAETLFEARVKPSMAGFRALARATLGGRHRKKALAALAVAALSLFLLIKTGGHALPAAFLAISLALGLFFLRTPERVAERMMKALPDESLVTILSFARDAIYTENAKEHGKIDYHDLRRLWVSPDFYLFYLADDSAFALSRQGVTRGDPAKLQAFLEKKASLSAEAIR